MSVPAWRRQRRPQITRMTNEALLDEFALAHSWFGDDFSLSTPSRHDYVRADRVRAEIMHRMVMGYGADAPQMQTAQV